MDVLEEFRWEARTGFAWLESMVAGCVGGLDSEA